MAESNIKELADGVKQGRKIQIQNYKKPKTSQRLTEEVANVVIDCNLEDYSTLLRKASQMLNTYPQKSILEISRRHKTTVEEGQKALQEITDSVSKRLNRSASDREPDGMIHHSPWITEDPESGYIYFKGKLITEMKLKEGSYKKVNSKPKTKIKREIESVLPTNIKTWKVHKNDLDKVSLV